MDNASFPNPFRPGAGHMPPYLAGREHEAQEFERLLAQQVIMENLVLTGLRGVGKTVLLETFKPAALKHGWLWVGNDLSEAASLTESHLITRLLADLAVPMSTFVLGHYPEPSIGLTRSSRDIPQTLDFDVLHAIFDDTPGLASDKLKAVLEYTWEVIEQQGVPGIVFSYDEADHAGGKEYPTSLLLDVFQSIQRKGVPFLLLLAGLPTLFPKLVAARTFAERMFHVVTLDRLSREDCDDAILKPISEADCPVRFSEESVRLVYDVSRGYPYFIQYICREAFDVWQVSPDAAIPIEGILHKLDADFFAGRWARATDRQRDLLIIIASLDSSQEEFTVQEIVAASKRSPHSFSPSLVNQMLSRLSEAGFVYKNRWGKYSLAVPLLDEFIGRQQAAQARPQEGWRRSGERPAPGAFS